VVANANALTLGRRSLGRRSGDRQSLTGLIDDVRIYNQALTAEQVKELARGRVAAPTAVPTASPTAAPTAAPTATPKAGVGLVAHWKLDDRQGTVAKDSSGNGNDGAIEGSAQWTKGKRAGALYLSGKKSQVEIANETPFDITERITVTAWIKSPPFTREHQAIVTKGDDAWRLQRDAKTRSISWCCTGLSHSKIGEVDGNAVVDDGKWHHVAGVYDGTTSSLYVDGRLDASQQTSGSIRTTDHRVRIGSNVQKGGRRFVGIVDDVRVYSRALSPEEIQALFEGRQPAPGSSQGPAPADPDSRPDGAP
jgi:hypothetical protein